VINKNMNNSYPTRYGLPWTSVYKFSDPVDSEKLRTLKECWEEEDWGENFQNNMRDPSREGSRDPSLSVLYPCTRTVEYNPNSKDFTNKRLETAILNISEDIKNLFSIPMSLLWSELTLLIPKGSVRWHHDRMNVASLSIRVMIPLTNNNDIKYSFCSWNENTPTNESNFSPLNYLSNDIHEVEMKPGFYYTFNRRIPHKTDSNSSESRGLLMIDMIPTSMLDMNPVKDPYFLPITEFEKTKILLP
jgi:hypothetical protein